MGWMIYAPGSFPRCPKEYREEIVKLCTFETDDYKAAPVAASAVGTTWYVANRYTPKTDRTRLPTPDRFEADDNGGYTVALVFLTRLPSQNEGWGYKDMDECMGPVPSQAPLKILNALSPIIGTCDSSGYAKAWRARCHKWANRPKLIEGIIVETKDAISFQSGLNASRFKLTMEPHRGRRRRVWLALDGHNARVRLSENDLNQVGFEVIGHSSIPGSVPGG